MNAVHLHHPSNTAIQQALEELRQSEEQFRFLVDGVRDYAIFMLDQAGNVVSWNTGAEKIKGYRADEILGHHFSCFYSHEDIESERPERVLESAAKNGRFEDEGWRLRKERLTVLGQCRSYGLARRVWRHPRICKSFARHH